MTEKTIRPGSIQAWFAAIRPKTWGVALAPIFIGISMALSETGHGRLLLGLLTLRLQLHEDQLQDLADADQRVSLGYLGVGLHAGKLRGELLGPHQRAVEGAAHLLQAIVAFIAMVA